MGTRVLALIIALVVLCVYASEGFADKPAKAKAIYDWFARTADPSYNQFRRDLGGASNIVEYEDVLRLSHQRNLTLATVTAAI